jgi:hypothetical protein
MAYVRSEEVIREYKKAGNDQFDDKTYSYPWYHDERWDEATDTLETIEDEVDELYKIVEGMDYI